MQSKGHHIIDLNWSDRALEKNAIASLLFTAKYQLIVTLYLNLTFD
ncbi:MULTISPECIES: hypothetical protein [Cyanophyceae]|nr:hypothetical protein [Trichocoleus sp. FACHB-69]MBD1931889.1 hypothetical protein [Trichocoleus sp. FACHB-69]